MFIFEELFFLLLCLFLIVDIGIQKRNQEYTLLVSLRNTILEAFSPENTAMWPPELLILLMLLAPGVHGKCSWFCVPLESHVLLEDPFFEVFSSG